MARQSRKRAVGLTAKQMEAVAAALPRRAPVPSLFAGEAASMLVRRGFRPSFAKPDLPFPRHLDGERAERLAEQLSHYAFRLFLRGAILRQGDFAAEEATQYVTQAK